MKKQEFLDAIEYRMMNSAEDVGKPTEGEITEAAIWFIATQDALELRELGARDMAHAIKDGLPPILEGSIEPWLETYFDDGAVDENDEYLIGQLDEHWGVKK